MKHVRQRDAHDRPTFTLCGLVVGQHDGLQTVTIEQAMTTKGALTALCGLCLDHGIDWSSTTLRELIERRRHDRTYARLRRRRAATRRRNGRSLSEQ